MGKTNLEKIFQLAKKEKDTLSFSIEDYEEIEEIAFDEKSEWSFDDDSVFIKQAEYEHGENEEDPKFKYFLNFYFKLNKIILARII